MKWSTTVILALITPCATAVTATEIKASVVPCHNAVILLEGYERNSNDIEGENTDYMFVEKVIGNNAEKDFMPCPETEDETVLPSTTGESSGDVEPSDPTSPTDSGVPDGFSQCVATNGSFGTSSSDEVSVRYNYKIKFTEVVTDTNALASEVGDSILNLIISSSDLFPGCIQNHRNLSRDRPLRNGNARVLLKNIVEDVVGITSSSERNVSTPSCKEGGGSCSVVIEALLIVYMKVDENRLRRRHLVENDTTIKDAVSASIQESMENGDLLKAIANTNVIAIDYLPLNAAPEIGSPEEKLPIIANEQATSEKADGMPDAGYIAIGSVTTVLLGILVMKYRKREVAESEDAESVTDEGESVIVDESLNHFVGVHQLADDSLQNEDFSRISDPQMIDDGSTLNESHSLRDAEKEYVNAWTNGTGRDLQSGYRY